MMEQAGLDDVITNNGSVRFSCFYACEAPLVYRNLTRNLLHLTSTLDGRNTFLFFRSTAEFVQWITTVVNLWVDFLLYLAIFLFVVLTTLSYSYL